MRAIAAIVSVGGVGLVVLMGLNAVPLLQGRTRFTLEPASMHDTYYVVPSLASLIVAGLLAGLGVCQLVLGVWSLRMLNRDLDA